MYDTFKVYHIYSFVVGVFNKLSNNGAVQYGSAAGHCFCCAGLMEVWEARGQESSSMSAGRQAGDQRQGSRTGM